MATYKAQAHPAETRLIEAEERRILAALGATGDPDDYEWIDIPLSWLDLSPSTERESRRGPQSTRTR